MQYIEKYMRKKGVGNYIMNELPNIPFFSEEFLELTKSICN